MVSGFESSNIAFKFIENTEDEFDVGTERAKIEDLYFIYRAQLEVQLEKIQKSKAITTETLTVAPPPISTPKLPEIHLPSFNGDPLQWTSFYASFDQIIHKNTAITTLIKFQYLRNALKGSAADVISALDFNEKNYSSAMQLLKERFDDEKLLCEEHIRCLFNIKKIDKPSSVKLVGMLDSFNSHLRSLTNLGRPVGTWDDLVVHLFISKLDNETICKWVDDSPSKRMATYNELSEFIKKYAHKLDLQPKPKSPQINSSNKHTENRVFNGNRHQGNSFVTSSTRYRCVLCDKDGHSIYRCSKFLKKSVQDRRKLVEENRLCFNCLKSDHMSSKCSDLTSCRVCSKKHHTLLHVDDSFSTSPSPSSTSTNPQPKLDPKPSSSSSALQSISCSTSPVKSPNSYVFLGTAVVNFTDRFGEQVPGRVLLDSGSQLNFMTESFLSKLGLSRFKNQSSVCGIGNSATTSSFSSSVTLSSRNSDYSTTIDVLILRSIAMPQPSMTVNVKGWNIPHHLKLADPKFFVPQNIDVLLGAEIFVDMLSDGRTKLAEDLPILQNSVFGWIVSGRSIISNQPNPQYSFLTTSNDCLDDKLERFWDLENVPEKQVLSIEEQLCEKHFVDNSRRDETGRFMVRLPFLKSPDLLGNSLSMAKRRFFNLERRLCKNHELRDQYTKFIDEYVAMGHMKQIAIDEVPVKNFFFPHHCVLKPNSSSTKLRVVFDGSARSSSGLSLNELLMVGPVVQFDLFTILMRFRTHPFVFSADISKMYRQINIHPDDQQFHMILWRNQPSDDLQFYKLTTVTYGTACAPFLATRCLNELSTIFKTSLPLGSAVIGRDVYVDDVLTGASSIDGLLHVKYEVEQILSSAGMELKKWYSNCPQLLNTVPRGDQETLLRFDDDEFIKTLGVHWKPSTDEFHMLINTKNHLQITKRTIISDIARVFDPLGLSAPVITRAKLFLQRLWSMKVGWDDQLDPGFVDDWLTFYAELPQLKLVQIPRYLFDSTTSSIVELHGFSDASEKAYGAAVYTRCPVSGGFFKCSLLCAKSRIAPLKKVTLPRLELCAAQLLAHLMDKILKVINFETTKKFYWSDSSIVLYWIRTPSSSLKTFVANRISTIQQLTDPSEWNHVESKQNPADAISRGLSPSQLCELDLWFHGPNFLRYPNSEWPKSLLNTPNVDDLEFKKLACTSTKPADHYIFQKIDPKFHNSIWDLRRISALVCRFSKNCKLKDKSQRKFGELSKDELNDGFNLMIRAVQSVSFAEELQLLHKGKPIVKNPLRNLSVFLDGDGIIRVGGRLQHSLLPYSSKHPILLPKDHHVTLNLFSLYHNRLLHAGPQSMLAGIREMFWPINRRRLASKIYHDCITCAKANPRWYQQRMGNLPSNQLLTSSPFSTRGVDFCGPAQIHHRV